MDLEPRLRSAITLGVLCLLLLLGLVWGVNALTAPFPSLVTASEPTGPCSDRTVAAGDEVHRVDVTVSVYNASKREGLAGDTMEKLVTRGFGVGATGNAPIGSKVDAVQIWTDDPSNPAVKLVASQFGPDAKVVEHTPIGYGVTVVVGDDLGALKKGRPYITATASATVCSPVID